jgi:membrane protein
VRQLIQAFGDISRDSVRQWQTHRLSFQAAGLAFYLALSLAPLLIILIEIGGLFVGRSNAEKDILGPLKQLIGAHAAGAMRGLAAGFFKRPSTVFTSIVSIILLLLGAAGVFEQLKQTLDEVWGVKPRGGGILSMLRRRSLSVLLVVGSVIVVLVLVAVTTFIAEANFAAGGFAPTAWSLYTINLLISLAATTLLFGVTFKVLPDTGVRWTDVWAGAAITALLFIAGQFLIGFFMARSGLETEYGRATAMVVILVWLYYSAQVYLFGATITRAYAVRYGSRSRREVVDETSRADAC